MSDRLDEIEARAKAATAGPLAGVRSGVLDMLAALCRRWNGPDGAIDWEVIAFRVDEAGKDVADVPWLIAQLRERDAEIARLRGDGADAFVVEFQPLNGGRVNESPMWGARVSAVSTAPHRRAVRADLAARLRATAAILDPVTP